VDQYVILYDYTKEHTPHMLQEIEAMNSPPAAIVSLLLSRACQQIHLQQTRSTVKIAGSEADSPHLHITYQLC